MDRKRRHLVRPVAALARADGSVMVPARVYGAARRLARTPYRAGLELLAERLMRRRFDDPEGAVGASLAGLAWARPGPAARWLTGEALAEVSVLLQSEADRSAGGSGQRPGEFRARAVLARSAADLRVLEQAAEIRSQRLHAPFLDNQVVRACRALPEALRVQPGARSAVLRTVLEGAGVTDLPPGWGAPSHASSAAATRAGLRVASDSLVDLFATPLLAEAGLVEARVVRKALRSAAAGEPLPLDGLAELVSLELWLGRLLARRGTCWTGTPARARAVPAGIPPRRGGTGCGGRGGRGNRRGRGAQRVGRPAGAVPGAWCGGFGGSAWTVPLLRTVPRRSPCGRSALPGHPSRAGSTHNPRACVHASGDNVPVRYRILGVTQAEDDQGAVIPLGGPRVRALLAALALRPGRVTAPQSLIDEVWADDPPQDAPAALQALVGRLRRALGKDTVISGPGGYRLAAVEDRVDLFVFESLVRAARAALDRGDVWAAARDLDEALALWNGPALADLPDRTAAARPDALRLEAGCV